VMVNPSYLLTTEAPTEMDSIVWASLMLFALWACKIGNVIWALFGEWPCMSISGGASLVLSLPWSFTT
jgi:hypothetical protein